MQQELQDLYEFFCKRLSDAVGDRIQLEVGTFGTPENPQTIFVFAHSEFGFWDTLQIAQAVGAQCNLEVGGVDGDPPCLYVERRERSKKNVLRY